MASEIKAAQYEPQSPDEHIRGVSILLPVQDRGGFVFMLAYTKKENADAELFLQILNDQIHRLADSFGKEANPQHRFEQFLGALNETLSSHVREGRFLLPIEHVHALVGVASSRQMFLSGTGELTALFLHKKPSQRYQIFNLFRGIQTEQSLPTWEKTFAVVLDGDLHPGDVFCVCDRDLQQAIPPEELNQILCTLPPVSSVEKIRQYFSHKDGFLLTVVKVSGPESSASSLDARGAVLKADVSVDELQRMESETHDLLEDQRPKLSSLIQSIMRWIKNPSSTKSRILQDLNARDSAMVAIKRVGRIIWRIMFFLGKRSWKHTKLTIKTLANPQERARLKKRIRLNKETGLEYIRSLIHRSQRIPRATQFLILGIGVAVIVLTIGISFLSESQARSAEEKTYRERLTTIDDLMERAAGAVIYKDEDQARNLYVNAQTMIAELPTDTPERASKAATLNADLENALDEIRHLVTIPNPPLLGDLANLSDGVFGNSLIQRSGALYVFGSDGRVYTFNRESKRFEVVIGDEAKGVPALSSSEEEGRLYFLGQDGAVYFVSAEDATLEATGAGNAAWVDMEAYANRLYVLRPTSRGQEGQILRFDRSGSKFSGESNWITSRTVSFDAAISLAVDGNVYVLMKDGGVTRFVSGSEEGWNVGVVDPTITSATKIWTNPESKYLYILEPATNRLIVFEKESGEFVVQYRSGAFGDLTDFVVDEQGYTIYLLAGSKIYSIAASHIK
ncbi:hypothetical protein HZA87_00075 [Candidatus Uhrbacteria bacterium]|nr:hypothetical protein [Candidatus Uhrbacteria bacterium]